MIITIPVRRTVVRVNNLDVTVLKVIPGFSRVTPENADNALMGVTGQGEFVISNPLIPGMLDLLNTAGLGANEELFIRLEDLPNSNPGLDDDGPSITENLTAV